MKTILKVFLIGTVFFALLTTTPKHVWADSIFIAAGQENIGGQFDTFEAFMVLGSIDFKAPGFEYFSDLGWGGSLIRSDYILASGPSVDELLFDVDLVGTPGDAFSFDFLTWEGGIFGTLREFVRVEVEAGWEPDIEGYINWYEYIEVYDINGDGSGYNRNAPVPEPNTLFLLGSGLLLGWFYRKKA